MNRQQALGQERIEQVWTQRAAQMAKVETHEARGEQLEVVLIRLGRELLGLEVNYVFDIRPREALTQVPRAPEWVAGVTNLRGQILSVVDLRAFLQLPSSGQSEEGLLVIVKTQSMELILLVDSVLGVETLPLRNDLTSDALLHHLSVEQVRAVVERECTTGEQRHVTVLDAPALFSDARLVVFQELD